MPIPVINALGVFDDPNLPARPEGADRAAMAYSNTASAVSARALADARAAGLVAVNVTLGHVAGTDDPYAATRRDIAAWDDFIASQPRPLRQVRSGGDLDAARAAGQLGVIYGFQ